MADHQRIWGHFQNERHDAFEASKPRLTFLIKQIERRARGNPRVLNIGIGDGYFDQCAQQAGWHIESIDPDERAVARLAAKGIAAQVGTAERLPQAEGSIDFVVISEVLEHLTDTQSELGLKEIWRVLKPGGRIVGTVPHAENLIEQQAFCPRCEEVFHRWGHQRSLTIPAVRSMLSNFTIEALGRTAFVDLWGRGPRGFLKGAFRKALAKLGEPIAVPTIWWVARQ